MIRRAGGDEFEVSQELCDGERGILPHPRAAAWRYAAHQRSLRFNRRWTHRALAKPQPRRSRGKRSAAPATPGSAVDASLPRRVITSGRPKWRRRGLCAAACAQWKSNWRDSGVCRRTWRTNSPPWRRGRLRHAVRAGTPAGRPVRHDAGCHDAHAPTRSGNFAQSSSNCPPKQRTRYASRATTRFS